MIQVVSPPHFFLPYMTATGCRSTTSRGSEAKEPSLGAGGGAGAGSTLPRVVLG
jgi:hypothetical protein